MGVVDFAQYLNSAISAGSSVEGSVVKIIADNGTEIGEGVFKVIEGGNGVASEVAVATQAGSGGAVATGMAYLTTNLPLAAQAIAPTLGVLAGVGLYSLAPEFWTDLSNRLVNAGKTIGGKVIAWWDGDNLYYDEETIETIKQALVDINFFANDMTGEIEDTTGLSQATISHMPFACGKSVIFTPGAQGGYYSGGGSESSPASNAITELYATSPVYYFAFQQHENDISIAACSKASFSLEYSTHNEFGVYSNTITSQGTTINNEPVHYAQLSSGNVNTITLNSLRAISYFLNYNVFEISYVILYGSISGENNNIQDGAVYPTDQPYPLTYPEWYPFEYDPTLPDPSELPNVYPVKYPGIGDEPYPTQDPAQNPEAEPVPEVYPVILPDFPIPEPITPTPPQPEPPIDPDPQPEPDPIPEDTPINPDPDPVNPNPTPDPSLPIVVPPLPNTVNSNKLFTVYNPTSSQLDALGGYLWDRSIIAAIRDIWQEPMDGLISLQQIYVTPVTGSSHNIILGFLDSGVSSAVVSQQFVEVNCGTVTVPENKKNATDYAPYTSLHLYLPFIGIVELDTNECMKSSITVKYKVDVYTGTCLATVSINREEDMPNDPILYTFSGNCSQQLPLTSGNATGILSALIGGISTGISVASGGGLSTLAGAQLLGNSLTHEMMHVSHSGNISANAGIMGQKKPYLIIGRRHGYDANNYNSYYGFPANKTVVLGNHVGFCRVKSAWIKTRALQEEYDEIMKLLEDGVFI